MLITLNPDVDVPVFQQIHDEIVLAIARGQLFAGDKLDPVRQVAADIGINPATVKHAYDLLVADGLVETAAQEQQVRQRLRRVATLARAQGFSTEELHSYLDSTLKELA